MWALLGEPFSERISKETTCNNPSVALSPECWTSRLWSDGSVESLFLPQGSSFVLVLYARHPERSRGICFFAGFFCCTGALRSTVKRLYP
jgi:hypothetical protein